MLVIRVNNAILVSFKASKAILIKRLEYSINLSYILLRIQVKSIITSKYKCSFASFIIVTTLTLIAFTKTPFAFIIIAKSFS